MYCTRFAIIFDKSPKSTDGATRVKFPVDSRLLTRLRLYPLKGTASTGNDGAGAVDCDSRRAVGPIKTIRGVYMTQLNRLRRLAALSASNEWSF